VGHLTSNGTFTLVLRRWMALPVPVTSNGQNPSNASDAQLHRIASALKIRKSDVFETGEGVSQCCLLGYFCFSIAHFNETAFCSFPREQKRAFPHITIEDTTTLLMLTKNLGRFSYGNISNVEYDTKLNSYGCVGLRFTYIVLYLCLNIF
jgi:hypothetical protein